MELSNLHLFDVDGVIDRASRELNYCCVYEWNWWCVGVAMAKGRLEVEQGKGEKIQIKEFHIFAQNQSQI